MLFVLTLFVTAGAPSNVLVNSDFSNGLAAWPLRGGERVAVDTIPEGTSPAARLRVPADEKPAFPCLYQQVPVAPGDVFAVRVQAAGRGVADGYGVYLALEFYDVTGKRLSYAQSAPALPVGVWTTLTARSVAPDEAVSAQVCLLLNGHGEALFKAAELTKIDSVATTPLSGPVTLTVTNEVVCPSFIGFGVEDDGWFYNEENASHGVTEADVALREGRVEWMHPATVRMFFWYKDWNPSGDWETFDFDTPNMRSHYRTLDLYQRLGARVNATGVEWGVEHPYADPARAAKAIGALMEHLIREKGYNCVRDWTLTNEPNAYFAQPPYSFELYTDIHRRVRGEFERRHLAVNVVGSDDTDGLAWFTDCVQNEGYYRGADLLASHRYFPYADRVLSRYFYADRLSLLAGRTPRKPFVVWEFGFQDGRSGALANPVMKEYRYAIWTAAFVIEGLNRGVAGFSIWCLHESYYPGNGFMEYGLWDYKDDNWQPRPVYYAWADFCRLTKPGVPVRRCDSSAPGQVIAALVGDTLFWVNQCKEAAEVRLQGIQANAVQIYTEASLHGDRECGKSAALEQGRFTAPPHSFGYLQMAAP